MNANIAIAIVSLAAVIAAGGVGIGVHYARTHSPQAQVQAQVQAASTAAVTPQEQQDLARMVRGYNENLEFITLRKMEHDHAVKLSTIDAPYFPARMQTDIANAQTASDQYKAEMRAAVQEYSAILAMPRFNLHYTVGDYVFVPGQDDISEVPGAELLHKITKK